MQFFIQTMIEHWPQLRWLSIVILLSILYALCNRQWFGRPLLHLTLPIDQKIPLIPWTIYIYNLWYPIMLFTFALLAIYDKAVFSHLIPAYTLSTLASFMIFIFFQNEVPRLTQVSGNSLAERLLRFTRKMDNPYNGFPSIHVLACTMTILAVQSSTLPDACKVFIWVSQLMIIAATLTTKQHVVLDLAGGSFMAILGWCLTMNLNVAL